MTKICREGEASLDYYAMFKVSLVQLRSWPDPCAGHAAWVCAHVCTTTSTPLAVEPRRCPHLIPAQVMLPAGGGGARVCLPH